MADESPHNDHDGLGSLRFSRLSYEIQEKIAIEAILSASSAREIGCLAAVNKSWQIWAEAKTFRNIHISLRARDQTGVEYLLTMLTPARLEHLQELTIDIEWPFFLSAQPNARFSGAVAVQHMVCTVFDLANFIRGLDRVAPFPTARGLNLVLRTVKPAFVAPHGQPSERVLSRRRCLPVIISSWWADTEVHKLAPLQRRKWVQSTQFALFDQCPTVPIVTGLAFPPDFFPVSTMKLLLGKFPNLRSIRLDPQCELRNPEGWRTGFFNSQLRTVIGEDRHNPAPAPEISTLVIGRTTTLEFERISFLHLSYYTAATDPRLLAYINAIRNYTSSLKALRFDYFAAPAHFYNTFFAGISDRSFVWGQLEEVHISLYGDQHFPGKRVPMALHNGAHLSHAGQISVLKLFYAAGLAAAKMPRLQKMTIHIPRHDLYYIMAVTLQFTIQSRQDASLQGLWGSPGKLELWAAPRSLLVENIWTQSIARNRKQLQHIEWHSDECPDPMKGFDHWGKKR